MRPSAIIPARTQPHAVQYIRGEIAYDTVTPARGLWIGTIPRGAVMLEATSVMLTAFNATTTNAVTVGTNVTSNDIFDSGDIAEGTPGVNKSTKGSLMEFLVDTPVYLKYAQTGTPATAGRAIIVLPYVCAE